MKSVWVLIPVVLIAGVGIWWYLGQGSGPTTDIEQQADSNPAIRKISAVEVAQHNTKDSCWMIIEGKVYDATQVIPNHKGGEVILQGCGKDATEAFNNRPGEGTPHEPDTRDLLASFYIGDLAQ